MPRKMFSSQAYRHKAVLVSGGCFGIDRALTLCFARAGTRLAIFDLDQVALDNLVQHLRDHLGGETLGLRRGVADADTVERTMALAVERFGDIGVLVNDAGITHRGVFAEIGLGVFRKIMAVSFFGAVRCTCMALPSLLERRGQVVVLDSLTGFAPLLYRNACNASKHVLHGLFDTPRMKPESTDVSVTLACPGFTATDLHKSTLVGDDSMTHQPVRVLGNQVTSSMEVAEAIFQGAARRRRLLVLSNVSWRARLLVRFFPRLFERLLVSRLSGLKPQP